ncbi:hypothetical protein DACRYDRAFT_19407 [Dacryopinax primogenitus]|uniref:JmjC domain-containing protein n=1 Tax=Dacryopinax primogenitus (strain DJM 731) TaxID=1858805 RepID=M5GB15_DACPD|nr:uncharacterized protein DACRYDRAFT_19407 [Dacryopinax primogenitus]EJU06109.1 hypothetical protein DACRYDRAFT_19407 [Dacryopinax primogenitus]
MSAIGSMIQDEILQPSAECKEDPGNMAEDSVQVSQILSGDDVQFDCSYSSTVSSPLSSVPPSQTIEDQKMEDEDAEVEAPVVSEHAEGERLAEPSPLVTDADHSRLVIKIKVPWNPARATPEISGPTEHTISTVLRTEALSIPSLRNDRVASLHRSPSAYSSVLTEFQSEDEAEAELRPVFVSQSDVSLTAVDEEGAEYTPQPHSGSPEGERSRVSGPIFPDSNPIGPISDPASTSSLKKQQKGKAGKRHRQQIVGSFKRKTPILSQASRGPCITCGKTTGVKMWKQQKGTGEDQCRPCYDRAYRQDRIARKQEADKINVVPTFDPTMPYISPLGKRKTKPAGFYSEVIQPKAETHTDDEPRAKRQKTEIEPHAGDEPQAQRQKTDTSRKHSKEEKRAKSAPRHHVSTGLRVQDTTCKVVPLCNYHHAACRACITKDFTSDECRFKGCRWFEYAEIQDVHGKVWLQAINGPFFLPGSLPNEAAEYPANWNTELTGEHLSQSMGAIASYLLPIAEEELDHASQPNAVRRPREAVHRHSCDTCGTSLAAGAWYCKECGSELCFQCFQELASLDHSHDGIGDEGRPQLKTFEITDREKRLMRCKASRASTTPHYVSDFIPITPWTPPELQLHIQQMRALVSPTGEPTGSITSAYTCKADALETPSISIASMRVPISTIVDTEDLKPAVANSIEGNDVNWQGPIDPSGVGSLPLHQFHHQDITEAQFHEIWRHGEPVVIADVLDRAKIPWSPTYFMDKYGETKCLVVDCNDDRGIPTESTVKEFFQRMGTGATEVPVLKLKDWPPTAEFSETFPELFHDFNRMVPFPNYGRRDGVLNLASHFPSTAIRPDLGPKMYNALESKETSGGRGTTRLHLDMADAVNVMTWAAEKDGQTGCAAWDIFRTQDSEVIRTFLQEAFPGFKGGDPIHSQLFYLDSDLRRQLFEKHGVRSWRIYQRPGQAVFIPAGCAHQVCNLADAIKVATDFVSPESVPRCGRLREEYRHENTKRVWKQDVLSLETTLWHAWTSCRRRKVEIQEQAGTRSQVEEVA